MGTETIPTSKEAVGAESPSDLELQIIRQIEYYFGNFNLSKDKFLREQITLDDGWVPLETMVKFNRLKKLSDDFNVITEALKKSPKQLMEISEDCKKIRRRTSSQLPEDFQSRRDEIDERTLYVKGFKKNNTLDELLDFFREYGVENIYMRKNIKQNNKPFKGSVFVTFEEKANAENFLTTKGIKFKGTELLKEWKKDYIIRKDELYKTLREEKEKRMLKKAGMNKEEEKDGNEDQGVIRFETAVAGSVLEKLSEEDGARKIDIGSSKAVVSAIEGDEEEEYWKLISKPKSIRRALSAKLKFGDEEEEYWKLISKPRSRSRQVISKPRSGSRQVISKPRSGSRQAISKLRSIRQALSAKLKFDTSLEPPQKKVKTDGVEENNESSTKMEVSSDIKKDVITEAEDKSKLIDLPLFFAENLSCCKGDGFIFFINEFV